MVRRFDDFPLRLGYPEKGPRARIHRSTPLRMSSPPRVTMKEGSRSRVINVPQTPPMKAQMIRAAAMAAHQGQSVVVGCTSCTAMVPPTARRYPSDRSISPSSSTKISAMERTMNTALC